MPELPEVEVTRRSVASRLEGATVRSVRMGKPLRWPIGVDPATLAGTRLGAMTRRGKYLWLPLEEGPSSAARPGAAGAAGGGTAAPGDSAGGLLIHLGMSGALSFEPVGAGGAEGASASDATVGPYEHFTLQTDRGRLSLSDPRRFGAVVWSPSQQDEPARKLLAGLGPEPFDPALTDASFHAALHARRINVKAALLSGDLVVGAGNIYASEALFLAGIDPRTRADKISKPRAARLLAAVRQVLARAIEAGGSTLKDFHANGEAGLYQREARVYGRAGLPCFVCGTPIRRIVQGQRATFFCPVCQKR